MGSVLEKFDEWAEDEDEEMMQSLRRRFGPFLQLSLAYPSWKPSMRHWTLLLFLMHTFLLLAQTILFFITTILALMEWDLECASLTTHFSILMGLSAFIMYYVNYQRKYFTRQNMLIVTDVGTYRDGRIYDHDFCVEERKRNKTELLYYLFSPIMVGVTASYVLTGPYFQRWVSGIEIPLTPNMVNKNLPLPCWYPFPTQEGLLHVIAVLLQLSASTCVAVILIAIILLLIFNTQRIRYEMRVIGYSLRTLYSRSEKMFLKENPHKKGKNLRDDPEYQKMIGLCLRDSIVHYQAVKEILLYYAMQLDLIAALAYSIGAGVIAMCLFNILIAMKDNNYTSIIVFAMMASAETLVLFVLSLCGESITSASVELKDHLYYSKWYKLDMKNQKTLHNFQTSMIIPIVISALGLIDLNMKSFSSIINASYSFFNIMNTQIE